MVLFVARAFQPEICPLCLEPPWNAALARTCCGLFESHAKPRSREGKRTGRCPAGMNEAVLCAVRIVLVLVLVLEYRAAVPDSEVAGQTGKMLTGRMSC